MSEVREERVRPSVPEKREQFIAAIVCDLCGRRSAAREPIHSRAPWQYSDMYEINKVTISHEVGASYPDGGDKKYERFHVCPDCWKGKVVPWFESQGAKATHHQQDW